MICIYFLLALCQRFQILNGRVWIPIALSRPLGYPVNTEARFFCDTGYAMIGAYSSRCQPSGAWEPEPPTCTGHNINVLSCAYFFRCNS